MGGQIEAGLLRWYHRSEGLEGLECVRRREVERPPERAECPPGSVERAADEIDVEEKNTKGERPPEKGGYTKGVQRT